LMPCHPQSAGANIDIKKSIFALFDVHSSALVLDYPTTIWRR
jgi:hypothetical protein